MIFNEYLYGFSQWTLLAGMLVALLGGIELAFLYGRRVADRRDEKLKARVATLGGTLTGALALLIGFTFAMSLSRFNARREAFQQEVNDLDSVLMMSSLLPVEDVRAFRELMGYYVTTRVSQYWWERPKDVTEALSRCADLEQTQLWDLAVSSSRRRAANGELVIPAPISASFLNHLNTTLSDRTARRLEINSHVPEAILWLLLIMAVVAVSTTGYASGLHKARAPFMRWVLVMSIALTLLSIIDLDRPRRGLIRIDQRAMAELRDGILARNQVDGLAIPMVPADELVSPR